MKDMFHLAVTLTLCVPQCSKRVRFMGVLLKSFGKAILLAPGVNQEAAQNTVFCPVER